MTEKQSYIVSIFIPMPREYPPRPANGAGLLPTLRGGGSGLVFGGAAGVGGTKDAGLKAERAVAGWGVVAGLRTAFDPCCAEPMAPGWGN